MNLVLPLSGQAMASAAMPILLTVAFATTGVVSVAAGQGAVHEQMRSRSMTALGALFLLGAFLATRITEELATYLLFGVGFVVLAVVLIALGGIWLLAKAS